MISNEGITQKSFLSDVSLGFEWFYFDFHSIDDDIDIIITFHRRAFNIAFNIILLDIFFYQNNVQKYHFFYVYKDEDVIFEENPFRVIFPHGKIVSGSSDYRLEFQDTELSYHFILEKCNEWQPRKFDLFDDLTFDDRFYWSVWVPRGNSHGEFLYKEFKYVFRGEGYHDQNWGNAIFNKYLTWWYWGKYITDKDIIIYGDLGFKNGSLRQLIIYKEGGTYQTESKIIDAANGADQQSIVLNRFKIVSDPKTKKVIDEFIFNINRIPYSFSLLRKIIELIFVNLHKYKWLRPFYNYISNTKYQRVKSSYYLDGKFQPLSFHEEMTFK